MATCAICGNEFKNNSGLSGHKQLAHRSESAQASGLERSPERFAKPSEQLQERLLEQIQEQLERLEALEVASSVIDKMRAAAIESHKHGMSDPECPGCIDVVGDSLAAAEKKGVDKTVAYYESIPGVKKLKETWESLKAEANPAENLINIIS